MRRNRTWQSIYVYIWCLAALLAPSMQQPNTASHVAVEAEQQAQGTDSAQIACSKPSLWGAEDSLQTYFNRALPHKQLIVIAPAEQRAGSCFSGRHRSALRVFLPASMPAASNQSSPPLPTKMPVIIQLAAPAAGELDLLVNETYCGQDHSCLITATAPAAVLPNSSEVYGQSLARVWVALPPAGPGTAEQLRLSIQADPCNPVSTDTLLEVNLTAATLTVSGVLLMASA